MVPYDGSDAASEPSLSSITKQEQRHMAITTDAAMILLRLMLFDMLTSRPPTYPKNRKIRQKAIIGGEY